MKEKQLIILLCLKFHSEGTIKRSCKEYNNVTGGIHDAKYPTGCTEEMQGLTPEKTCFCETDLCNSSNLLGSLNIVFFGGLALFYLIN